MSQEKLRDDEEKNTTFVTPWAAPPPPPPPFIVSDTSGHTKRDTFYSNVQVL
jgi:hypothetical protein